MMLQELAEREGFDYAISSKYSDYYYLRQNTLYSCWFQEISFVLWSLYSRISSLL
jgi:hypothetical protein